MDVVIWIEMMWINLNKKNDEEENVCKNTWYGWSINYIPKPIKKWWVGLWVFLKQTQLKIIINQHVSKCIHAYTGSGGTVLGQDYGDTTLEFLI